MSDSHVQFENLVMSGFSTEANSEQISKVFDEAESWSVPESMENSIISHSNDNLEESSIVYSSKSLSENVIESGEANLVNLYIEDGDLNFSADLDSTVFEDILPLLKSITDKFELHLTNISMTYTVQKGFDQSDFDIELGEEIEATGVRFKNNNKSYIIQDAAMSRVPAANEPELDKNEAIHANATIKSHRDTDNIMELVMSLRDEIEDTLDRVI